jgi:hypothetical protein
MQKIVKMWLLTVMVIIGSGVESKACETPTYESVAQLYVATFNRAPDSGGINYWLNESFGGKACLEEIASSFFDQPETKALYPEDSYLEDFIRAVYRNLFNREPESEGLIYWTNELENGNIKKSEFILAVINGARDTEAGQDKTILQNKKEVGLAFANADLNDVEQAKEIMQNVTGEQASVESAFAMIDTLKNGSGDVTFDPFTTCVANADYDAWNIHLHYTMEIGGEGKIGTKKETNNYVPIEMCSLALTDGPFTVNTFHKTIVSDIVADGEIIKGTITYDSVAKTIHYEGITTDTGTISCTEQYASVPFPMLIENDDMLMGLISAWDHASGLDDPDLVQTDCPDSFYEISVGEEPELTDTDVQGTVEIKIITTDNEGKENKIYFKVVS